MARLTEQEALSLLIEAVENDHAVYAGSAEAVARWKRLRVFAFNALGAEERGRRRGVEERDGLLKRLEAAQRALGGFNYVEWGRAGGEPECEHGYFIATPCRACDVEFVRTGKARVALAPRDSGKDLNATVGRSEDGLPVVNFDRDALHGKARK